MSYARFGHEDSDVYVFLAASTMKLECCACHLSPGQFLASSTDEFIEHLDAHRAAGDTVPEATFEELREDQAENDERMAARVFEDASRVVVPRKEETR